MSNPDQASERRTTRTAAHFLVSGKVQGVWYRASTRNRAVELGLDGYANNLADGRVEVLAIGSNDAIDALEQWLRQGPEHARVDAVTRSDAADDGRTGFVTG